MNAELIKFFKATGTIILSVFAIYLTIGMLLGCLPSYIEGELGGGSLTVGIVIGLQSLATLLFRAYSGKLTDTIGAKQSFNKGLLFVVLSAIIYLLASGFIHGFGLAILMICVARTLHGMAESLIVTGGLTWAIHEVGIAQSGKVMTWNGIAMYGGIAIGAPLAIGLEKNLGIQSIFWTMLLLSLLSLILTFKRKGAPVDPEFKRIPFYKVISQVSAQGLGLAFSSIGFACISSFITLLFTHYHWIHVSKAFIGFGVAYVAVRIFFGHLPDRLGGYKVAIYSFILAAVGQLLIALSITELWVIIGCILSGIGFSLIFPALGVLAITKVPPQMRGTALGAFAAFFDLSLAIATPLAGLLVFFWGYNSIYYFGGLCSLVAIWMIQNDLSKS